MRLNKLLKYKKPQQDPDIIIFYSSYVRSEVKNSILLKGLIFRTPPNKLNNADDPIHFELFDRDICSLGLLSAEDLDFIKIKTKNIALSKTRLT